MTSKSQNLRGEEYYEPIDHEPIDVGYDQHIDVIHAASRFSVWRDTEISFTSCYVLTVFLSRFPPELRQLILSYLVNASNTPAERLTAIKSFSWSDSKRGYLPYLNLIKTPKMADDFCKVVDTMYFPWLNKQFELYRKAMHEWSLRNLVVRYNTDATPWAPFEGPLMHVKAFLMNHGEAFSPVFEDDDGWTDLSGFVLLRQAELCSSVNVFHHEWIAVREYRGQMQHHVFRRPNEFRLFERFETDDEEE